MAEDEIPPTETLGGMKGSPRQFMEALIASGSLKAPLIDLGNGQRRLIVPEGFHAVSADDPYALPPHIRGTSVTVDDRQSLVDYVNRFSDDRSVLIANFDTGTIGARLDWHSDNDDGLAPGPRQHTARLVLRDSEEFKRWDKAEGELHPQAEFAAFLEENAVDIVDPEPAVMIEISRDLEATQGVTFKSSTRLESGDRAFVYENETRTKGEIKVPREFVLEIPLYNGEAPVQVRCAFRFRVSAGGLLLGFEWRRVEYQRRAHFTEIAHAAAEATGRPVFYGRTD